MKRQVLGRLQLTAVYWFNVRQVLGRLQLTAVYWCNDETGTGLVAVNSDVLV